VTRAQKNRARLAAALAGGPGPLLIGVLGIAGTGLAALASEKRAADEKAAAASTSADS
jgi:hypothetical protein